MSFSRYIAFSIVASSVLCGATAYTDWGTPSFNDGDSVTITNNTTDFKPTNLKAGITITNGVLTANITNYSPLLTNIVADLSGSQTFDGNGNITFNVNSQSTAATYFNIANGGSLNVSSGIIVNANGQKVSDGIFKANGNSTLTFSGDTTINGNGNTAITMGSGNLNINQSGGKNVNISGNISLGGGTTNIKLDSNNDQINGTITATNGTTKLELSNGSKITGAFNGNGGNSNLTLTIDGSTYSGSVTNAGTSAITIKGGGKLEGKLTTSGNSLNLTMDNGTITQGVSSTATTNTISLTNSSTIQKVTTTGAGGLSFLLNGNSSVTEGIHTSATSTKVDIAAVSNSRINGTSEFGGADEVRVIFKGTAGAENLNFKGTKTNNLAARNGAKSNITSVTMQNSGKNQVLTESTATFTIGSLSMSGQNNNIARTDGNTTLQQAGANLTVTGDANITATTGGLNQIALQTGSINGSLTTSGDTKLYTLDTYHIQGGVNHTTSGNFNADLYSTSQISSGIQTSGTGNATVNLHNSSKLNGNSNFATVTNTVNLANTSSINGNTTFSGNNNTLTLQDSATITGNTSFHNTSTLTANNGTTITGQITTASGTANYTFGSNGTGTTGATVNGGINTEAGATKTTANFNGSSTLQNGTSNFHSNIDITFADSSKAENEQFNVNAGTANITFKDSAQMNGGTITTNGGTSNITFQNSSKMINGEIATVGGTTNLTASDQTELSNTFTQSGGNFNVTFSDSAKFNGSATQTGGDSDIKFNNQSTWTGNFNQSGANSNSKITFSGTASMTGNITTDNGTTNITFNNGTKIKGNIAAQGSKNQVTFDTATLDGNLTLDGMGNIMGHSKGDFTNSTITGNVQGYDDVTLNLTRTKIQGYLHQGSSANNSGITGVFQDSQILQGFAGTDSINKLNITHSDIQNGVTQSGASLTMTATTTTISGGFSGTNNSQNSVTMTNGSITGTISQNTGSLDFLSKGTDFKSTQANGLTDGFKGVNSTNTLKIANGDFGTQHIRQTGGSLKAEIVSVTNIQNFNGKNSENVINFVDTQINNVIQEGGTLEFNTNSLVKGIIKGTSNSHNKITVSGADVNDNITQDTGSMELYLTNVAVGNATDKKVEITNADFGLYASYAQIRNLNLSNSNSTGVSDNFRLTGDFNQAGGISNITFSNTTFNGTTIFNNTENANLIFTRSNIQSVEATKGLTSINLSDGSMQSFSGSMGSHSVTLVGSTSTTFTQNGGSITLNASNGSEAQSVSGTNFSNVAITLDRSEITGSVINNGESTITMQDSKIGGKVEQTGTSLSFTASNSTLTGQYKQTDGTSMVNFMDSKILGGIDLLTLANGTMNFTQNSQIEKGVKAQNSRFTLMLLSGSSLEGGLTQDQGQVTGTVDASTFSGGMTLSSGLTNFSFYNSSTLGGNITATNHNTSILLDNSTFNGSISVNPIQGDTGGSLTLIAQNGSTINGNGGGTNRSQVNVKNADFALTLDTNSTFNGDIAQENNKQTILVKQNSNLNGDITNTDVTSSISVNNATIGGSITQNQGSLALDLSNDGNIGGSITLDGSNTTLSGSGTGNQIGGDFSQNGGTLNGSMTGLTLNGTYSQNGGTSSATFTDSAFNAETTITSATSSSLTFDHSTLKGYTTDGGTANTLKLLNGSTMSGTLTLSNGAQTTLTMETSTLTGDNGLAITASDNSFLTFNTKDSTITGEVKADTGGLKGTTDNTSINGDITLEDTTSSVSFTNNTTITGNLTATDGNNTINLDNSSITGSVSQTGGTINLDLSNGSSVGQNLTFKDATANLTGSGAGNSIGGDFDSDNTTLTGDASGLTLTGTFTQTQGSSNITFRNESSFNGAVSISDATSSNLKFTNQSGINNTINITKGANNAISLSDNSFITGNMTLSNTTATISASNNSSINGDLETTDSTATLSLNSSTFEGATTQNQGTLNVNANNNSTLTSDMTLDNGSTNITLGSGSNLTGTISANENPLNFTLRDNSSYNSLNAPQDISVTNADLNITASNNSVFGGNLTHTSNNGNHTANLTFNSNSFYSGTMSFENITVNANFNQSGIFSNSVSITSGSALFNFDGSTNGGTIQTLTANDTDLSINTTNQSHITINDLQITGNNLNLTAKNSSRLTANVTLNGTTTATYTANTNGNLNVNTNIANQASTLTANIDGGMMQGSITQNANGNNGFPNGEITLSNGGRWAITDDTQIKELTLNNTEEQLYSDAIFASAFNSPLSFVDFTLDFADENTTSRVGKEIIRKPEPINGQPIPEAGEGRTYVRQLQVNEIKGNNGLFRVYADLGTNLADNILASQASGSHLIQVQYRAETFREIGGDRIVVAKVTDPSTTVSFKGTQSEIGLTKYDTEIIKENSADGQGFEWIIGQATPAGMSYSSKIIASILQSQYRTFMIEVDTLDRRMGDLEFIKRDKGFWIRSYIGSNTKEATDYSTLATDDYYSIWSGFDYNSIGLTVHNYVGVFFNYTGINTESKDYIGKSSNIAFGFYNTFKANSGFYADILAKYIYTMSEFTISNYSLAKNSPKIDNHKLLLNAEIGYSFYYGEKGKSGYVQPQFQVTSGYIHKTDLSVVDVSGETINATIGRNFPVSIRAGAFWGQVFGEKIKSHIKLGTSFVYDVDSGGVLNFSDSSTELQFKQGSDFRWVLSAVTDFTFSEFFKLYASFDTSFFGNYNTTYSANVGIRFTFGRPSNTLANVPTVYSPYTPPVVINDDKRTVPVVKNYTTKDIDQNYVGRPRRIESYIQGNSYPNTQQGSPTYIPSRQSHRDITSEVEF